MESSSSSSSSSSSLGVHARNVTGTAAPTDVNPPLSQLLGGYVTVISFFGLLYVVFMTIFVIRRRLQPIQPRDIVLSMLSATFGLVHFVFLGIDLMLQPLDVQERTCYLVVTSSTLLLPLWALPYYLRCFLLIFKFRWNVEKLAMSLQIARAGLRKTNGPGGDREESTDETASDGRESAEFNRRRQSTKSFAAPNIGWYSRHKWMTSGKFIYSVLAGVTLLHVAATIAGELTVDNSFGAAFNSCISKDLVVFAAFGVVYLLILVVLIVFLWRVRDAFFIKTELRVLICGTLPLFIAWIVCYLITIPAALEPAWFAMAAVFYAFIVVICYPIYLSTQRFYHLDPSEYQIQPQFFGQSETKKVSGPGSSNATDQEELIDERGDADDTKRSRANLLAPSDSRERGGSPSSTTSAISAAAAAEPKPEPKPAAAKSKSAAAEAKTATPVAAIPQNSLLHFLGIDEYRTSFEKFCIQAWCVELLCFFMDTAKFSELPMKEESAKKEAKRILTLYLTEDAELEVENISDKVMQNIKTRIETGDIGPSLFSEARKEVYEQMAKFVFPIWQKSPEFKKVEENYQRERTSVVMTNI